MEINGINAKLMDIMEIKRINAKLMELMKNY